MLLGLVQEQPVYMSKQICTYCSIDNICSMPNWRLIANLKNELMPHNVQALVDQ